MRRVALLVVIVTGIGQCVTGIIQAEDSQIALPTREVVESQEVIVQIGGRFCEYHREDVEGALRQFEAVRQVEFLNNQGTVLVHYRPGREMPQQFAGAVERALATGWNCSARVDRGEGKFVTNQQEERP